MWEHILADFISLTPELNGDIAYITNKEILIPFPMIS